MPLGVRRLAAKWQRPLPTEMFAGRRSLRALPISWTSFALRVFWYERTCSQSGYFMSSIWLSISSSAGPQWVCEQVNITSLRPSPCRRVTWVITASTILIGTVMRSVETKTAVFPVGSLRATALAHRSCTFPSAGFDRPPYPDIHIGCSGVITVRATPACQATDAGEGFVGAAAAGAAGSAAGSACELHSSRAHVVASRRGQFIGGGSP